MIIVKVNQMVPSRRCFQAYWYDPSIDSYIDGKSRGSRYPVKIDVYLNGEFLESTKTTRYIQNSIGSHIGAFYDNTLPFIGCLASVMIYNIALSGTNLADLSRYRKIMINEDAEQLFIKLRPEVLSERVGMTTHLLGVSTVCIAFY